MQPAVFLDLDNTMIENAEGPQTPEAVTLIKGAAPAIASLRGLGYRVVVVANHEGVARGTLSEDDVQSLHAKVAELVRTTANGAVIDAFYYCPFHPRGSLKQYKKDHRNRKPKPGMLLQAAEEMQLDLASSWMIGDELADVQAGHAAGARTILLRPDAERLQPVDATQMEGATAEAPDRDRPAGPDFFAVGLVDVARLIAQQPRVENVDQKRGATGRKWDAEKIAKLQVPRPDSPAKADGASDHPEPMPAKQPGRAFRPWGAPLPEEDDKPIVAKPYRKRQYAADASPASNPSPPSPTPADSPANSVPPESNAIATEVAPPRLPASEQPDAGATRKKVVRIKRRPETNGSGDEGVEKMLRLILHELRGQRGTSQEFSFLTIIAVALQLVAIICLLGGLFMGGADDGLFMRWVGVGLVAQLVGIATMLYGR